MKDQEKRYREEFIKLMQENPELPVMAMVDADVVADDCGRWMGSWGYARVDEYLVPSKYYESTLFKSDDDVLDTLERYLSSEEFDRLPESEQECREIYDALPWTKAIIVNIDLPD